MSDSFRPCSQQDSLQRDVISVFLCGSAERLKSAECLTLLLESLGGCLME